jgi:hypothetical protein
MPWSFTVRCSELDRDWLEKILEPLKIEFHLPLKSAEVKLFLTKLGETYFERKVKRLLDATEDGKLIEGHKIPAL